MRRYWVAVFMALGVAGAACPAHACFVPAELVPADVSFADAVVVGRIANYRIVPDQEQRARNRAFLKNNPDMSPDLRRALEQQDGFLGDYARFDVIVEEVLKGAAPARLTATWDNSTFGEPKSMGGGLYLIALRRPGASMPPLRGPSATILPSPEPNLPTVLQAPCAPAFIFQNESREARAVREILGKAKAR